MQFFKQFFGRVRKGGQQAIKTPPPATVQEASPVEPQAPALPALKDEGPALSGANGSGANGGAPPPTPPPVTQPPPPKRKRAEKPKKA